MRERLSYSSKEFSRDRLYGNLLDTFTFFETLDEHEFLFIFQDIQWSDEEGIREGFP